MFQGDNLIYGICEAIDGERDPQCLMLSFRIVQILAGLFPGPSGPLADFAGDLFGILGCYFPIHFTHVRSLNSSTNLLCICHYCVCNCAFPAETSSS